MQYLNGTRYLKLSIETKLTKERNFKCKVHAVPVASFEIKQN